MRRVCNRLITLGALLLTFSALAGAEFTCSTVEDCVHGESCRGDTCRCSTYWTVPDGTKGPCNVSTDPVCDDDSCDYGDCSVVDHKIECACLEGASGDKCQLIDENHCLVNGNENPCKNSGTCTNLLDDYECSCVQDSHWAGKTCEEYAFFSVMTSQQVVFEEEFTQLSVMLQIDQPKWHTMLLMFYVDTGDGTNKKVTLTAAPGVGETLLILNIEGNDAPTYHNNSSIDWSKWRSIEASFNEDKLIIKQDTINTHTVELSSGSKGTKVVFGGCSWLSEGGACGTKDNVYYDKFEGGVQNLTLDGIAQGYEGPDGQKDMFTCTDIACDAGGSSGCTASHYIPSCQCKAGYAGPDCSQHNQASFNGYTSKVSVLNHMYLGGEINAAAKQVLIAFSVTKVMGRNAGQEYIAVITGALTASTAFEIKIVLEEEKPDGILSVEDPNPLDPKRSCSKEPSTTMDRIMVEVKLNDENYYCAGPYTPAILHTDLSVVLGYDGVPAAVDDQKANFQGCITDLAIEGQQVFFSPADNVEADYMQCTGSLVPTDPCIIQKCSDRGTCAINLADYSADCECAEGFNGTTCENVHKCDLVTDICGASEAGECEATTTDPYYQCHCKISYELDNNNKCVYDKCFACKQQIADKHATACNVTAEGVAVCTCAEGWEGDTCSAKASTDKKNSTQTILIIVVVALLVLMVVLVGTIFTVRRCNRNNQGEGTYSPKSAELEMGATPPAKGDNIYKNSEVIENVNAESKLFETTEDNTIDTSYNIYNINAAENGTTAENGTAAEENVYDIVPDPSPAPLDNGAPVVQDEIVLPPPPPVDETPVVYETIEPPPPPPANDLPEPPTPLNTTAAETPNVTMDTNDSVTNDTEITMDTKDAGVDDVKVDIEECQDSNRLSTI